MSVNQFVVKHELISFSPDWEKNSSITGTNVLKPNILMYFLQQQKMIGDHTVNDRNYSQLSSEIITCIVWP